MSDAQWIDNSCHLCRIVSAISIHSYGNVLIFPWGYSMEKHPDKDKISRLAYKMMNNVKWSSDDYEIYVPGTAFEVFDRWGYAGGATDDWYSSIGIGYSFTWELPEKDKDGFHGFELPPSNIIRVGTVVDSDL